eukprot:92033-Chlamydomonas_euryale.AAC.2
MPFRYLHLVCHRLPQAAKLRACVLAPQSPASFPTFPHFSQAPSPLPCALHHFCVAPGTHSELPVADAAVTVCVCGGTGTVARAARPRVAVQTAGEGRKLVGGLGATLGCVGGLGATLECVGGLGASLGGVGGLGATL